MNCSLLKESGFTLLELAMVLFIITLILGAVLTPLSTRMEAEERKKTTEQLKEIRDSLIGYALVNGHLPCPDCPSTTASASCASAGITVNDGIEDGVDAGNGVSPRAGNTYDSCATPEGNLPWATLGVDQFDAWENRFIYRVTEFFADDQDGTGCGTATTDVSFEICSSADADIVIRDDPTSGNTVASNIAAIVISYGKNVDDLNNPSSIYERENQNISPYDDPLLFIDRDYGSEGNNEFDDILIWLPANLLIYRMVQAERLP